jgi:hypothetical protein
MFPPQRARFNPSFYAQAQSLGVPSSEDRELLAATSAGFIGPDLSLLIKTVTTSEALTILSSRLAIAANAKAFPLSVYTLITGTTHSGNRALIGSRTDSVPSQALAGSGTATWPSLALEGIAEPFLMRLGYFGLSVDTNPGSSGRMTIFGLAAGPVKVSGASGDFEPLDVGFEKESVAQVVKSRKGIITTDMQLALSVVGYREWGPEFLRLADK